MWNDTRRSSNIALGHVDTVDAWDFSCDFSIETNTPYHSRAISFSMSLCNNSAFSFNQNLTLQICHLLFNLYFLL
jgi:hypothetical protein